MVAFCQPFVGVSARYGVEMPAVADAAQVAVAVRADVEQFMDDGFDGVVVEQARRNLADMSGDVAPFSRLLDALETEMIRMGPNDTDRQDLLAALRTATLPGKG